MLRNKYTKENCAPSWLHLRDSRGPGSVVSIATAYGLGGPGFNPGGGRDLPHLSRPALRPTQPPVQ